MKKRLIILEYHHLGDALLSFPFIRAASAEYEVWVHCRPELKEVFNLVIRQERILTWSPPWMIKKRWNYSDFLDQGILLSRIGAEVIVSAWADVRVHYLMKLSRTPTRISFPMNRVNYFTWKAAFKKNQLLTGMLFSFLQDMFKRQKMLTRKLQRSHLEQAHWKDWEQLGHSLELTVSMEAPWFNVPQVEVEIKTGSDRPARWLIHVGARLPEKRWSLDKFQELAENYLEKNKREWVCLGLEEHNGESPAFLNQHKQGMSSWADLVSLMTQVDAVLCHDTSVAHLASAMGKRVVTLFGKMPPCWFAPYGNEKWVIAHEGIDNFQLGTGKSLVSEITVSEVQEMMERVDGDFNPWQSSQP